MKLSDASWVIPLLQAAERGETIQVGCAGHWTDMGVEGCWSFDGSQSDYRIKPKPLRYRLYKYNSSNYSAFPCIVSENQPNLIRGCEENVKGGMITWLTPWLDVPESK